MQKKMLFPLFALIIGGLFIWTSHYYRNQTIERMEKLLGTHVDAIAALVKKSVSQGVWSTSNIYSMYEERLITTAHLFSHMEEHSLITNRILDAEQVSVHLTDIQTPTPQGRFGPISPKQFSAKFEWFENIESGQMFETVPFPDQNLVCIIYDMEKSRTLLCCDISELVRLNQHSGIGSLLNDLVTDGIGHIVLQDETGVLAAAPINASVSRWHDDNALAQTLQAKRWMVRKGSTENNSLFEGLYPFKMIDGSNVLIRVAIDASAFETIKENANRRHLSTVALIGIIEFLFFILLVAVWRWQTKQDDIELRLTQQDEQRKHWDLIESLSATVAHEVRNPLSTILMTSQRLHQEFQVPQKEQKEFEKLLQILSSETRQLNKIVSDFLEFGKPITLRFEPTSLKELVQQIVENVSLRATNENKSIRTQVDVTVDIDLDRQRFTQILSNLLTNALDALEGGGHINIYAMQNGDHVTIEVKDNGIGVTIDQLQQILKPFVSYKANGTGLGLALVNRFVILHNGAFTLHSPPSGGVVATVNLPMRQKEVI